MWRPKDLLKGALFLAVAGLVAMSVVDQTGTLPERSDTCRIVSVVDGDTVRLSCPATGRMTARLLGFDTPEVFSPSCAAERRAGRAATRHLKQLLRAADAVTVVREGTDRYGRAMVRVFADGQPVSQAMIAAGYARPYRGGRRRGWCDA